MSEQPYGAWITDKAEIIIVEDTCAHLFVLQTLYDEETYTHSNCWDAIEGGWLRIVTFQEFTVECQGQPTREQIEAAVLLARDYETRYGYVEGYVSWYVNEKVNHYEQFWGIKGLKRCLNDVTGETEARSRIAEMRNRSDMI